MTSSRANPELIRSIHHWIANGIITADKKPNVLLVDYIGTYPDRAVVAAMQLNALS